MSGEIAQPSAPTEDKIKNDICDICWFLDSLEVKRVKVCEVEKNVKLPLCTPCFIAIEAINR